MRTFALALLLLPAASFAGEAGDYNPIGRRDPFEVTIERTRPVVATSALERVELSEIRLEGIISGISDARATVTVPGGESFLVHAGTRMGKWGGRVASISTSEVVVREESVSLDGVTQVKETALRLAPPSAEE